MRSSMWKLASAMLMVVGLGMPAQSQESGFNDGVSAKYYETLKGKKIIYIPISMGMDLAAAWGAGLQRLADQNGMQLVIRDPNWNLDQGVQAITQAITEKPDILLVQNLDLQAYSRSLKQAVEAGIRVLTVNVKATTNTTGHVGVDFYKVIEQNARQIMTVCSPKAGKNGKVALMQVGANIPINFIGMKAIENLKKEFPDVTIVADQVGNVDATKAHSIAATVLRQHPDLCGYIGMWDGQDSGIAAAVREAGLTGKVYVGTTGAAEQATCDKIADGSYDYYVSFNIPTMVTQVNAAVVTMLQQEAGEAAQPFAIYVPAVGLTKDTLSPTVCWTVDQLKRGY